MSTPPDRRAAERDEDGLLVNALVGAVVSVLLAFIPFSPVLGGGVAGYLQGGDERAGLEVGAISGAIASIPVLAVLFLALAFFSFITIVPDGVGLGLPLAVGLLALVVAAFALLFVVALSAVGGYVGAAIARERRRPPAAAPPVRGRPTETEPVEGSDPEPAAAPTEPGEPDESSRATDDSTGTADDSTGTTDDR